MKNIGIVDIKSGTDVRGTKVIVNPRKSKAIQEALFTNGWTWKDGSTEVLGTDCRFLYLRETKQMQYGNSQFLDLFNYDRATRIVVSL